jgi:hypothetical protein
MRYLVEDQAIGALVRTFRNILDHQPDDLGLAGAIWASGGLATRVAEGA